MLEHYQEQAAPLPLEFDFSRAKQDKLIAYLSGVLHDKNMHLIWNQVAAYLRFLRGLEKQVIATLLKALKDKDDDVRVSAVRALGNLQLVDEPVVTALLMSAKDKNKHVKTAVALAMSLSKPTDERIITTLTLLARDDDDEVRMIAAMAQGLVRPVMNGS